MAKRVVKLAAAIGALGLVWLVLLPWMAERPRMASHLEWLDDNGIDPSAMYYTELEMMQPIFTRLALENRKGDGR